MASGLWAAGMISIIIIIIIITIIIISIIIIIIIVVIIIIIVVIVCKGILEKRNYTYEDVQDKDNGPIVTGQSTLTYMSFNIELGGAGVQVMH